MQERPLGERILESSRKGMGHEVKKATGATRVGGEVLRIFPSLTIDDASALLTPSRLLSPLPTESEGLYRGYGHDRAVNWYPVVGSDGDSYTLTIKGGNILDRRSVLAHRFRLKKDIPGSVELGDSQIDWDSSLALQEVALQKLGRFTHTTIPFSVRVIDAVPISGEMMNVRDYFNSSNYPIGSNPEYYGVPEGVSVGEYIMGKQYLNLEPSEYLYLVRGLNTRVDELPSYTINNDTEVDFTSDPQFHKSNGVQNYGQFAEFYGTTSVGLMRTAYETLGDRYGMDFSSILPDESLPVLDQRRHITERLVLSGMGDQILNTFIDRICEVAALGHSAGYSFTSDLGFAGSLASRNVTFEGEVLDLTSLTRLSPSGENNAAFLAQDLNQLIESVGCLRRMVSQIAPEDLFKRIATSYVTKLKELGASDAQLALSGQLLTTAIATTL